MGRRSHRKNQKGEADGPPTDIPPQQQKDEEQFNNSLELAEEKDLAMRLKGLRGIIKVMVHRYKPDFIAPRMQPLLDQIECSLRRGRCEERITAVQLAPLLVLQLGNNGATVVQLNRLLMSTIQDTEVSPMARGKCAVCLGLTNFLLNPHVEILVDVMRCLHIVFSESLEKTAVPQANQKLAIMQASALGAWGLLLTLLSRKDFVACLNAGGGTSFQMVQNLRRLFDSDSVEMRLAAGEVLALIVECGREDDEDFLQDEVKAMLPQLKTLANDMHKYHARRDRKSQRTTFKTICLFLEENETPEFNVKIEPNEMLCLDTWARQAQYETLCEVIGPGMAVHLVQNDFLRGVFGLNDPMPYNRSSRSQEYKWQLQAERAVKKKRRASAPKEGAERLV